MLRKLGVLLVSALIARAQSVPTANYDLNRSNANTSEITLTPSNVSGNFSLRCSLSVDDRVFAQPLEIPAVSISGSVHDLVIVVTMNDSIYAFDANSCAKVWSNVAFDTPYASYPHQEGGLYGALGCLSTPVVDVPNAEIWAVCDSSTGPTWNLRSFSLTTGSILTTTAISGQFPGTGDVGSSPTDPTSGSNLLFFPAYEFQRASLALANGNVYVAFGGLNDTPPWHGWIMAYSESSQSQVGIFCTSPNGYGAAVWMSGGAPAIDSSGNLYVSTGNGGGTSTGLYTNSVIALSATLSVLGTWTTSHNSNDNSVDADVAANRLILLPSGSLASVAGKDFYVDILSTSCLIAGGSGTSCQEQEFQTNSSGTASSMSGSYGVAFFNSTLYLPTTAGSIYAFTCSGSGSSTCTTTPAWTQSNTYGFPGPAQIAGSCNGGSNCILWVGTAASGTHTALEAGILHALNASSGSEYWNSGSTLGYLTKFAAPTIANGHVIIATQSDQVQIYGLMPSSQLTGAATLRGSAVLR